ncbi:MAG TPA: class I SAM-dependent methyltransferase [Anaerolineales bacterium]|nr:class I SAM-dependent methyltransferase [Anaerolineales bacterium]HLO32227.1 class I SAM-dependent methyltransferase [Anaerolineales bacterium]
MDHADHVNLLRPANLAPGGTWADLGAGSGAFTLALRQLIGPDALIYAVDKDRGALSRLESAYRLRFPSVGNLSPINQDFTRALDLPALDGVLMANSLHYVKDKEKLLRHVRDFLKPKGVLLLVEYNVDVGNMWVPYPLSFETFQSLAPRAGFTEPHLLAKAPSRFLKEFYSALAYKTKDGW